MGFDLTIDQARELLDLHDIEIELTTKIGCGGQKCVFAAAEQGEAVALKILSPDASIDRVTREIQAMRQVQSEYVVRLHSFRQLIDRDPPLTYLIEEFVDGPSLASRIDGGHVFGQDEALLVLRKLTQGLIDIWSENLVHRDIKPQNIMLRDGTEPVIIDFGVVRHMSLPAVTDSSAPRGPCTPMYAPMEVLLNRKEEINCRADIFSLGVVAYEMVSGQHPFEAGREHVVFVGDFVRDLEEPFCRMIHRMMHKRSYRRYRDPEAVMQRIRQMMGGE